ncbi:MAG: peroxiredoxin-like family protein [Henriciella sp.]|nr:peroxiredoxin-like family protein [Henriciella sp.]
MSQPMPRQKAPDLTVALVDGADWSLDAQTPKAFTLIVVYRGFHCGICKTYLQELETLSEAFFSEGVEILAVSADPKERAEKAISEWDVKSFPIGYDLSFETAADWGLYASAARKEAETPRFFEPGLFLVDAQGLLYFTSVQNMPFARPALQDVLAWVPKVIANSIPARGELDVSELSKANA